MKTRQLQNSDNVVSKKNSHGDNADFGFASGSFRNSGTCRLGIRRGVFIGNLSHSVVFIGRKPGANLHLSN